MLQKRDEVDYLAGTQLEVDPNSFGQVVREAFLLEHDCVEAQDIAEVIGVHKSRISQMIGHPEDLKPESIQRLFAHLKSDRNKRRIVRAWIRECLDIDIAKPTRASLAPTEISDLTLKRVSRMVRQNRIADAARLALEASLRCEPGDLREQLRDRACTALLRLDLCGKAMTVAREIAEDADARHDKLRLAGAHFLRAHVLMGMQETEPDEVEDLLQGIDRLVQSVPHPGRLPYIVPTTDSIDFFRLGAFVSFIERGELSASEERLNTVLGDVQYRLRRQLSYRSKFNLHLIAARLLLLLGKTFAAQEHVDAAFASGKLKNVHSTEMCGLVQGRILIRIEPTDIVREHLRTISNNCMKSDDLYHRRMAEGDLAKLENEHFPPLPRLT